ncbi:DUF262 domain-containing protein [Microbacterium galbinum]|uniref:DUF262 domain-containing protein n=1 Tax=Microbacterium galbinum TaxID=2851646 RepID=UPI001FFDB450|nr:DUF262 domain-containing protein [Microbacterium galbinum]MCK2028326.1 DUF262 domain-containing protein [Microbacterium galbinum]
MTEPLQIMKTAFSVLDFLEWQRQRTLDLRPFYQRRAVWNPRVKSLLMDSILKGYPLPLIFLHRRLDIRTSQNVRQVVDGQQRLRTILSFVDPDCLADRDEWDDFRIQRTHNREYAGMSFADLPEHARTTILQTALSVNVLPSDIPDVTILQIFQRMNTTGLKLKDQEVRNGTFFGEFKDVAYSLAYEQNQRWVRWGLFDRQDIGQMAEVEFTSDLLGALMRGVSGKNTAQITKLYRENDEEFRDKDAVSADFRSIFDRLADVYEERLSVPLPDRFRSPAWFYPVFATVAGLPDDGADPRNDYTNALPPTTHASRLDDMRVLAEALVEVDRLISTRGSLPDELAEGLRRQTTHKASRLQRIRLLRSVM